MKGLTLVFALSIVKTKARPFFQALFFMFGVLIFKIDKNPTIIIIATISLIAVMITERKKQCSTKPSRTTSSSAI